MLQGKKETSHESCAVDVLEQAGQWDEMGEVGGSLGTKCSGDHHPGVGPSLVVWADEF